MLEARPPADSDPVPAPAAADPTSRETAVPATVETAALTTAAGPSRDTLALEHGVRVRAHMMRRLAYPADVRAPGVVVVALVLGADGRLIDARVVEREAADPQAAAALAAARAAAPYPAAPEALGPDALHYDVRVSFRRR